MLSKCSKESLVPGVMGLPGLSEHPCNAAVPHGGVYNIFCRQINIDLHVEALFLPFNKHKHSFNNSKPNSVMSEPPQTGRHSHNNPRPPKAISRKPGKLALSNTRGYSASVRKVSELIDPIALKSNAVSDSNRPNWPLLSPDEIKQEASPLNNHSLFLHLNTRASRIPLPSRCVRNSSAIDRRCQQGVTSVGTQTLGPVLMDSTITASQTSPPPHYLQPNPHYPPIHPSTPPRASSTVPTVLPKRPSCVHRSSTTDGIPTTAPPEPLALQRNKQPNDASSRSPVLHICYSCDRFIRAAYRYHLPLLFRLPTIPL